MVDTKNVCTCGQSNDYAHDFDCGLQLNNDWLAGRVLWINNDFRVVEDPELWMDDSLIDYASANETKPFGFQPSEDANTERIREIAREIGLEHVSEGILQSMHGADDTDELEFDPGEQKEELYWCTCQGRDDLSVTYDTVHSTDCLLTQYDPWCDRLCEWDHLNWCFVWNTELVPACNCPVEKTFFCSVCGVTRSKADDPWEWHVSSNDHWDDVGYGYMGMGGAWQRCEHADTAVIFPDGTAVYPRSSGMKREGGLPDLALYLETSLTPVSWAVFIPWQDYGLPKISFHTTAEVIKDVWWHAKSGLTVEVGCIGAHGRTGTVLACMAILSGVPHADAVQWVKKNHCQKAVEGERQVWFVSWFNAYVNRLPAPPRPPDPPPYVPPPKKDTTTTTTQGGATVSKSVAEHNAEIQAEKDKEVLASSGPYMPRYIKGWPRALQPSGPTNLPDMIPGDKCPFCQSRKVQKAKKIKGGLQCPFHGCDGHKGFERCGECGVRIHFREIHEYACWNTRCKNYSVLRPFPAYENQVALLSA